MSIGIDRVPRTYRRGPLHALLDDLDRNAQSGGTYHPEVCARCGWREKGWCHRTGCEQTPMEMVIELNGGRPPAQPKVANPGHHTTTDCPPFCSCADPGTRADTGCELGDPVDSCTYPARLVIGRWDQYSQRAFVCDDPRVLNNRMDVLKRIGTYRIREATSGLHYEYAAVPVELVSAVMDMARCNIEANRPMVAKCGDVSTGCDGDCNQCLWRDLLQPNINSAPDTNERRA